MGDHRINEFINLLAGILVIDVEHDYTLRCADLRRGQADTGRGIHGFEHVVDQLDGFAR